jgi:hypothetical protein
MKIVLRWLLAYRRWHNALVHRGVLLLAALAGKVPSFSNFGFGFVGAINFLKAFGFLTVNPFGYPVQIGENQVRAARCCLQERKRFRFARLVV